MEEMVTITAQRYSALLRNDTMLDVLTSCLFNNADISWDGESLQPDAKAISSVLKSMYPDVYKRRIESLLKRKGE